MSTISPPKACPRCGSARVQRSHRRTFPDGLLHGLGAQIRRCRQCNFRHAAFGFLSIRLGEPEAAVKRWTTAAVLCAGVMVCIVLILWVILHRSKPPG